MQPFSLYMCWADTDPYYQEYFPDCKLQISLPNVPLSWNVNRFPVQPKALMVDSGAYSLINNPEKNLLPKDIFNQQLNLVGDTKVPTILCHLDFPVGPVPLSNVETNRRIEKSIGNAYEFMNLFHKANLPTNFKSLGVIQGNSYDTIGFCARELQRLGFDYLGIGSLAGLYKTEVIVERVKYAISAVGNNLHIFGISGIEVVKELMSLGINSFDSSTPMKTAMYNTVFYSHPLRRYMLPGSRSQRNMQILSSPLPCDCPICVKNPTLIMGVGTKKSNNFRAVHNYYHWRRELENNYL